MRDAGGLALNMRQQRCRIVAQFLTGVFQIEPLLIRMIEPAAIRQFVLGSGAEWSAGTIRVIGGDRLNRIYDCCGSAEALASKNEPAYKPRSNRSAGVAQG
jgi:hypothetical protein